jgi:hypothetical protein
MEQLNIDYDSPDELDARIDQEEAHFYFTVESFQDSIRKYGCAFVLSKLDPDIRIQIKEKINV